jgi:ubiquinone/menaquinone biosynthesis C-methylase UbiE
MGHNDFVSFVEQQNLKQCSLHLLDYASLFRLKLIQEFIGAVKDKEILDLGCGNGSVSLLLWYLGAKVHSVDITRQALNSTRNLKKINENTAPFSPCLCMGDATKLPLRNEAFDVVFCIETLEHIQDDKSAIKEIERVTKRGGTVILAVPYSSKASSIQKSSGTYRCYSFKAMKNRLFSKTLRLTRSIFWCFPVLKLLDLLKARTFFAVLGFLARYSCEQNNDSGEHASSLAVFYQTRFWRRAMLPFVMALLRFNMLFQKLPYSNDVFLIFVKA